MEKRLILKRFKDMGLTSYEVKCYLSLLERDTLTVAEVSKLAAIPRPNAYEALEKLMSKGLCVAKPGATKQYSASDPSLLEEKLLVQLHEEAETKMDDFKEDLTRSLKRKEKEILERSQAARQNVRKLITELRPQYEKSRLETNPMDYIEIIKDPYQIHKRFVHLVGEAKEEILVFSKPPFSRPRENRDEHLDQETEVLKGGICGRCIYEIATDEEEMRWLSQHIDRAVRAGEEARVLKELPMKMAIFDSKIVLFALADPVSKQISLTSQIVEHPALAKSLKILFETLWEQAEDYHILKD
jgi:sugar-specific transcriptional regulator TrmB